MTSIPSTRLERHILWHRWEEPGIEHLHLREYADHIIADGMIVGIVDGHLLRLHYEVQSDSTYRFKTVQLRLMQPFQRMLKLSLGYDGTWSTEEKGTVTILNECNECTDIDLSASPFTNTLPIRHLGLQPSQSIEIQVTFIEIPDLTVRPERQRYTLIQTTNEYSTYRFEHLANNYFVDIHVDHDGLVLDYPGLFRRVWSQ